MSDEASARIVCPDCPDWSSDAPEGAQLLLEHWALRHIRRVSWTESETRPTLWQVDGEAERIVAGARDVMAREVVRLWSQAKALADTDADMRSHGREMESALDRLVIAYGAEQ